MKIYQIELRFLHLKVLMKNIYRIFSNNLMIIYEMSRSEIFTFQIRNNGCNHLNYSARGFSQSVDG